MSKIDAEQLKASLDIVEVIGQFVELKREGSGFKGCCPFHEENDGSFNVHPERQTYKCFGCREQGDVIDFVQKHKTLDFVAAVEFLGGEIKEDRPPRKEYKKPKAAKPVPLSYEDAKNHYTRDIMEDRADFIFKEDKRELVKTWLYKNNDSMVELVVVRFEKKDDPTDKKALSMYWNGSTIKLAGYPVLLFNRDLLIKHPDKPVLIVEGEPSVEAAEALTEFVPVTWNGGGEKAKAVDWKPLKNREVFIYPDDDQKHYLENHPRAGQLLPDHEQPGNKVAAEIKKKLPHAKIVKPILKAREIKKSGADIVEALQVMSVEELTAHILSAAGSKESAAGTSENTIKQVDNISSADDIINAPQSPTDSVYPFKVLGIADDGKAYFISASDRLYTLNPMAFTKTQLFNIADIECWQGIYSDYGTGGKMWEHAISDLVQVVNNSDFDPDVMRGRGAWREPDGRICYHDGNKTIGEYDPGRIFLRRPPKKIGLGADHPDPEQRRRIAKAAAGLTFNSAADCVRILGWSVLAPFAGGLPWRSACLLTAASGTGKTTILNGLVNKLSKSKICSGESTAAGVRQNTGVDSCSVIIDEAEGDSPKKQQNREDCFSLMRQSTSDDAPDVWKGTIDGKGTHFKLRSMFMFVSIDPTINSEADENRMFRINLKKPGYKIEVWLEKEKELKASLTEEICDGIRSYTWDNLERIIALANRVAVQAQLVSKIDSRTAFAESLLLAAYMAVFKNEPEPKTEFITDFVKKFYEIEPAEARKNENEEMVDTLLDSIVRGDSGSSYTIRELLNAIETGFVWSNADDLEAEEREESPMQKNYARQLAGRYGVGRSPDGDIAIAKNHGEIMRMLGKGKGYHQQLKRHPRLVDAGKNVSLGSGNVKNCVVIGWDRDEEGK